MPNDDEAESAIQALNGADFQGRSLTVNEARPRESTGGGGGRRAVVAAAAVVAVAVAAVDRRPLSSPTSAKVSLDADGGARGGLRSPRAGM